MEFRDYLKKNCYLWLVIFIFGLISHGSMLWYNSIGIDTEDIITLQSLFYGGWLTTGRQGIVLLKAVFGTLVFEPFFAGIMALLFSVLACILWTYLFFVISGRYNKAAVLAFGAVFLFSPVLTEQFYFKLQAMEISLGFSFIAINLLFCQKIAKTRYCIKNTLYATITCVFNIIAFGIYQSMVPLFIMGAVICFLLFYFFDDEGSGEIKAIYKFIGTYLAVFLVSFVINQMITVVFFSGSSYLDSQVRWFSQTFKDCLINIYWHVRDVLLGKSIYYSKFLIVLYIILAVAVIIYFMKKRDKRGKALGVIGVLFLMASPFYMTLICGVAPAVRSQLVLPFLMAFLVYFLLIYFENMRSVYYVLCAVCVFTGYFQLKNTSQLNYTDKVRYESDVRVASQLMYEINKLEDEVHSYPVVFIGRHSAELNNSCVVGETIGKSFFDWDTDVLPYSFFSTRRILGFMHTLGGNYSQGSTEQFEDAIEYGSQMYSWPMQGSVQIREGVIIIKLSD